MSRELIKRKITEWGGVMAFAADFEIRQASLSDFLNGKINPTYSKVQKIIKALNLSIQEDLPKKLVPVKTVYVDGVAYKKGDLFDNEVIFECLGNPSTSHQILLFQTKSGFIIGRPV